MNLQLYLLIEFPVLLLYFLPADDTCLPFICLLKRDIIEKLSGRNSKGLPTYAAKK